LSPGRKGASFVLSKVLEANDPVLKLIVQNLARICLIQKRPEEAEKYNLQLLSMLASRKDEFPESPAHRAPPTRVVEKIV
jgi:hypothetical protein